MVIEVVVIGAFGRFVFGVPMRGPLGVFLLVTLMGTLAFGAMGLLIASRARTVEGASGMMNLVMLPMWVASGVFFAASRFPDAIQPLVQALPLTAVVDALRLNMLQGAGLAGVWSELLILSGWLVVSFTLALRLFRWK
jgi:ABC-type multidrug transport system permease subunit